MKLWRRTSRKEWRELAHLLGAPLDVGVPPLSPAEVEQVKRISAQREAS